MPEKVKGKVKIINGDVRFVVNQLNEQGHKNLYIDGGKVIQSFLKEDLIDEMILTRIPVLLGSGIPLFGELKQSLRFTHKNTQVFNNALVKSAYVRNK